MEQQTLERLADSMKKQGNSSLNLALLITLLVMGPIALMLLVGAIEEHREPPASTAEPAPQSIDDLPPERRKVADESIAKLSRMMDEYNPEITWKMYQNDNRHIDRYTNLSHVIFNTGLAGKEFSDWLLKKTLADDNPAQALGEQSIDAVLKSHGMRKTSVPSIIAGGLDYMLERWEKPGDKWITVTVACRNRIPRAAVVSVWHHLKYADEDLLGRQIETASDIVRQISPSEVVNAWITDSIKSALVDQIGLFRFEQYKYKYTLLFEQTDANSVDGDERKRTMFGVHIAISAPAQP